MKNSSTSVILPPVRIGQKTLPSNRSAVVMAPAADMAENFENGPTVGAARGDTGKTVETRNTNLDSTSSITLEKSMQQGPGLASARSKSSKRNFDKLRKRLRRNTGKAIQDYHMIEQGDRIMVCLSGGKDSYTLLDILLDLQKKAPVDFELVAINLDQKQPGFPAHVLPDYLHSLGVKYDVINKDTYSVVKRVIAEGKTMCGLCSRLRRGNLYGYAEKHGFNKIALGHHRDDIIETLFLNMFNGGKLSAMPPKLRSDDGRNTVIRPLAYCAESDIAAYAEHRQFPIIPCNLCGSQDHLQRVQIKQMLASWSRHPGRIENIFRAICHVAPSQLGDPALFDFREFTIHRHAEPAKHPNSWLMDFPEPQSDSG